MSADNPSVTIIIAVFNGIDTIKVCLDSCLDQDYVHKEIIVIDGGSADGTEGVLNEYSNQLAYWVSEPDKGIYHAWNKALRLVKTDWVAFIGADDEWADSTSLSKMVGIANYPSVNFVCAKVSKMPHKGCKGYIFGEPWDYSRMRWRMTVGHTGMLHHVSLFEEHGFFDETYRIAGDYEFLLRAGKNIKSEYLPEPIVLMGGGGVSSMNFGIVLREGRRALTESPDFGRFYGWIFSLRFYLRNLYVKISSKLSPKKNSDI
jgi:glycosyltransferase involved in cell wall biosynthesis